MNINKQLKLVHDVVLFSTGYKKPPHLVLTDALKVQFCYLNCPKTINLQLSHIKLFHSTGAEVTRMQLVKVVITSVLVFAACAEGLWCRSNKNATSKGSDYKCSGLCSMCRRAV